MDRPDAHQVVEVSVEFARACAPAIVASLFGLYNRDAIALIDSGRQHH